MNQIDLSISKMSLSDIENLKNSLESCFDDFWNYETLQEEISSTLSTYFVAKYNNEIVGFAGIKTILDEVELMNIVTKKSERHRGIASCLLEHIIQFSRDSKKNIINLEVNAKNSIAINFYKKYNFKQVGLRKNYYHQTDDAIVMSLPLITEKK